MPGKVILAYVPVLHRGYLAFFLKHRDVETCYIFSAELIAGFTHLRKDMRALAPVDACRAVWSWNIFSSPPQLAFPETLQALAEIKILVVMPDEEECRKIAAKYLGGCDVEFDRSIFLRWDRAKALAEKAVAADRVIAPDLLVSELMSQAYAKAELATNLWRRVGAVVARNGGIILAAHNTQVPSVHTPYYEGDPRMFFSRGLHFELTTDEHAEARLVAEAARHGIALEGSDLYVTTFPCPPCAKLVARAGFSRIYFATGYAKLDGERILRERRIEIIRVEMKNPDA